MALMQQQNQLPPQQLHHKAKHDEQQMLHLYNRTGFKDCPDLRIVAFVVMVGNNILQRVSAVMTVDIFAKSVIFDNP